jgi:hypothetical protein
MMAELVAIQFSHPHGDHAVGDTAELPALEAKQLIRAGVAIAPPAEGPTKAELLERARELNVEGRSSMTKDELAAALTAAEAAGPS